MRLRRAFKMRWIEKAASLFLCETVGESRIAATYLWFEKRISLPGSVRSEYDLSSP